MGAPDLPNLGLSRSRRTVRERIDPRLTASLFANYRSATDALLELVDNAVDARVADRALELDVTIRVGSIVLTAVGGTGMSPRDIERDYLRWGASPKRAGDRIGRYGQGGKAAIGHLGNRFTIVASPTGDARAYAFRDDAYRDRSSLRTYDLTERAKPVDPSLGYIRIEIGEVDRKIEPARLRPRLADVYRPLLLDGSVTIRVDRSVVTPREWPADEKTPFSVRAGGRLVKGWYGVLQEPPPPDLAPGIRVYHLGRLIGDPSWFGHPGPAVHPGMGRLIGEVELPHVPVTLNKSDVERDSAEWMAVEHRLHRLLKPLAGRLMREDRVAATPQSLRTADQVRRILARALRLLESGQLFRSEVPIADATGPEVEGQLTLDAAADGEPGVGPGPAGVDGAGGGAGQPDDPGEDDNADATGDADGTGDADDGPIEAVEPPARRPVAAGTRRRSGFGDVVVRALDPRVRSAMVEEDGVRQVVINSRYPLFEVRKGDLWYQLETALREICVTIPEATVPEFERKVNELMLVSLSLTERRRRTRRSAGKAATARGAWARPDR